MDEVQIVNAESVEVIPAPAPSREPVTGQFAPGNKLAVPGSRRGSLNAVTALMKTELANYIADRPDGRANPLLILARIAENEEHPAMVRVQAADRLARYLAPRLLAIDAESIDPVTAEQTAVLVERIRALYVRKSND